LLVRLCFWFFLVVVGLVVLLSPLFLVRHDQARLCFLTQNATLVGWLCGVSAPGGLWEFVSVCLHVVYVVLEFVDSVWCVSCSAFYSLESSVWSSFLSCCCFCSLLASVSWAVLRFSLDSSGSCCFCLLVSSCCFCCCCCVSC
jgi:hypothetical protein